MRHRKAVKKSFTLSEADVVLLDEIVAECGFMSASEAVRVLIRFYAQFIRFYAQSACPRRPEKGPGGA